VELKSDGSLGASTGWLSNPNFFANPRPQGEFACADGAVYTGISHKGIDPAIGNSDEEDGLTTYCQKISINGLGELLSFIPSQDIDTNPRAMAHSICGENKVVTGAIYDQMENGGNTDIDSVRLFCSPLKISQAVVAVKPQCSDSKDNDGDTKEDAADPGCHHDGNVNNDSSYDPNDDDERNTEKVKSAVKKQVVVKKIVVVHQVQPAPVAVPVSAKTGADMLTLGLVTSAAGAALALRRFIK